jgi:hypothetical protein
MSSIAVLLLMLAGADDAVADEGASAERRRQAEVALLAPAKAKSLALASHEGAPAQLHAEPLLRWSNPTAGSVYGEVFLWKVAGRPAAIASVYRWYHPYTDATVEFASVSDQAISAKDGGAVVWESQSPGVSFTPLEDAPKPAASSAARMAQMKSIARDFSARLMDERGGEEVERELRLLNQPVHRYASPAKDMLDGALFAFVEGTDPEGWLLIEAATMGDQLQWRFALARMNADALEIKRNGALVQSWPAIHQPWRNRKAPYTFFSFDPQLLKTSKETP